MGENGGVRARRLASEWEDLRDLASCNTDVIRVAGPVRDGESSVLTVTLCQTAGLVEGNDGELQRIEEHVADFHFPRFFPAVPIEAYLRRPVFHPNVDPVDGFVCLWNRFSPGDTIVHAIMQLQQIVTWRMWNGSADHTMQPRAAAWQVDGTPRYSIPLPCVLVRMPPEYDGVTIFRPPQTMWRRRLG